jgi:hypothetical protein
MGQTRVKPVSHFEVKHKLESSLNLEINSIYPISSQRRANGFYVLVFEVELPLLYLTERGGGSSWLVCM